MNEDFLDKMLDRFRAGKNEAQLGKKEFEKDTMSILDHVLILEKEDIMLEATPIVAGDQFEQTWSGEYLYQPVEDVFIRYAIINGLDRDVTVAIRQTPLEVPWKSDFFWNLKNVFYKGDIVDVTGEFTKLLTIPSGEKHELRLNLKDYAVFTSAKKATIQLSYMLVFPDFGQLDTDPSLVFQHVKTNAVEINLHHESKPFTRQGNEGTELVSEYFLANYMPKTGDGIVELEGVPAYQPGCIDEPLKLPVRCQNGCDCSRFTHHCNIGKVAAACPVTCNKCPYRKTLWTDPMKDRTYSTKNCDATQKAYIVESEASKKEICRDVLWGLKNWNQNFPDYENAAVKGLFKKWLGRIEPHDVRMFHDGFVKICSADNYVFDCDPSETRTCRMRATFSLGFFQGAQRDILKDPKFDMEVFSKECMTPQTYQNVFKPEKAGNCVQYDGETKLTKYVHKAHGSESWNKERCFKWCQKKTLSGRSENSFAGCGYSVSHSAPNGKGCFKFEAGARNGDGSKDGSVCWVYIGMDIIRPCSFGCGAIAYVRVPHSFPRTIHLCPVYYFMKRNERSGHLKSAASVIIHELSHFFDVANTLDEEYGGGKILKDVKAWPGLYNRNSASWDYLADAKQWPNVHWGCFKDPQLPGCVGATTPGIEAGSMVTPAPIAYTKYPTTRKPITAKPSKRSNCRDIAGFCSTGVCKYQGYWKWCMKTCEKCTS